ncbi:MAG: CmpA/NrtA family ABC transporter substrate-binding protein [Pigmentiphaga sp.]|uniref:CmpA/NrtA family ABC transporter substrate-binding protein n=1 Tax=Pigmentiphaga sp. TaxID=1977564 RepID=UPI0029BF8C8B|nr:CmpA/NrtA family ABC transporter substrate-binding protein [Pigmentiphaga sp.]MDX3907437.1 CmpA/NrtA family ABC transporter substrate-binding protein [Pigmentiphaga sp.]
MSLSSPSTTPAGHAVAGSDAPEKRQVRVGFIALTDCAPLVIAVAKGYDRKYGLEIILQRQPSWAAVRDKLLTGELDASHALYGLGYGIQLGLGGPRHDMAILMSLNQGGQAITLSQALASRARDGASLARFIHGSEARYTFAHTFPTGSHAMLLYYWLAAYGIDPLRDVRSVVIPPPQMADALRRGDVDGYCVGEPWNALAQSEGKGFTVALTSEVWPHHPEKVLACTRDFADRHPHTARALIMALLEACRYLDVPAHREEAASWLALPDFVDAPREVIASRLLPEKAPDGSAPGIRFFADGQANFPYLSDGMWLLTQYRRWGMLRDEPDYLAVARAINRLDLYREAASQLGVAVPADTKRSSRLIDGKIWDGGDAAAYAGGFDIKA